LAVTLPISVLPIVGPLAYPIKALAESLKGNKAYDSRLLKVLMVGFKARLKTKLSKRKKKQNCHKNLFLHIIFFKLV